MARKVLISFLGTGPNQNLGKGKEARDYRPAKYHFDEKTEIVTSFIADALVQKYKVQDTILLGTPHSMWERVYEVFCSNKNIAPDEEYYYELAEHCDNANSKSELSIPHPEKIEKLLGNNSHVILLKYGINNDEIRENISIVLQLERFLKDKDELIVDITHSFRSLPLYIMNLLLYLKNVSSKNIKIANICYGMLDAANEFSYTPVVSLNGIMDVQDWITGAYNFIEFGNAYKMAKLLEGDKSTDYREAAKGLRKFADLKNLNRLSEFRKEISSLRPLMNNEKLPPIGQIMIPDIIGSFINRFPANLSDYAYKYRMAEWHEKHHNYGYAFINLVESALSYCCELVPDKNENLLKIEDVKNTTKSKVIRLVLNYNDRKDRDKYPLIADDIEALRTHLKGKMEMNNVNFSLFNAQYDKINFERNTLSHVLERTESKDYSDSIKELKEGLKYWGSILRT